MLKGKKYIWDYKRGLKNIIKLLYYTIGLAMLLIVVLSWVEVITQNTDMVNPTILSEWNIFELVMKYN